MIARSYSQCLEQHYKAAVKAVPVFTCRTREEGQRLRARAILRHAIRSLTDAVGLDWPTVARNSFFGRPVEEGIDIVLRAWGGCPPREHMCERVEEVVSLYDLEDAIKDYVATNLDAYNTEVRDRARVRAQCANAARRGKVGQAEVA